MCRHKHVCRTWFLHFRLGRWIYSLNFNRIASPTKSETHCKTFASNVYFYHWSDSFSIGILSCFSRDILSFLFELAFRFRFHFHRRPFFHRRQPHIFECGRCAPNYTFQTLSINSFPIRGIKSWQIEKLSFK